MRTGRFLVREHRVLAAIILASALLVRVIVPAGYMPERHGDRVVIAICGGTATMAMTVTGESHHGHHGDDGAGRTAVSPCAFADLAMPWLGGADAALLVAALAFAMTRALLPARVPPHASPRRLRPPLRAPPPLP